jgi:hypothetical protein
MLMLTLLAQPAAGQDHSPRRHTAARSATPEVRRPGAHRDYSVELEPHLLLQWIDTPYHSDVGPGLGFRASIPILQDGPIPSINNNLAISFGMDWAHFGGCGQGERSCGADDFWFPVVMQWNFFLTRAWSVFPEVGFAIHHAIWSYNRGPGGNVDCLPGPGGGFCEYSDSTTGVEFATWLGTRFAISDTFAFVLRVGVPSLSAGVSFKF